MKFSAEDRRLSGLVVPLSALRSGSSPGCGEFPDLIEAAELAASWDFDLIQLLPVNESGFQESPYSALSAFALNPIYLRIGELPELMQGAQSDLRREASALVDRFARSERVPYGPLLAAKLELLRMIWDRIRGAETKAALDTWIEANSWAKAYAVFTALKKENAELPWWEWKAQRNPSADEIERLWNDASLGDECRFRAWIQMRAEEQLASAAGRLAAKGVDLMGDIPILMNADSADVWSQRRFFRMELAAGAPPDMYSQLGQNWGFPIYNWETLERDGYAFWRGRLLEADKFYSAFRIDHVLGFFRIWALSDRENTGFMGRFVPSVPIRRSELEDLGFSAERIRWLSRPHIPSSRLVQAAGESAAKAAAFAALARIGDEDLYLFKDSIRGEKDIEALPSISPAARDFLLGAWRDRALFEFDDGVFAPAWTFRNASSWPTLSCEEQGKLESLIARKNHESEALWAETGRRVLGALASFTGMLPCAEDLGAVPDCVPLVLGELGIFGLRVLRWARRWNEPGQPYVPVSEYPELSVACPSVHDSSSLRQWWECEAERELVWRFASDTLGRDLGPCPLRLGAEEAAALLEVVARSASRVAVYPIQDILGMSEALRPGDPSLERINVPGTVGAGNWSYRMPVLLSEVAGEENLTRRVRSLAHARDGRRRRGE
jgi:4-alpha-glucanotransferase